HAILGHRHRLSGIAVAVVTGRLLLLILEVYIQLSGHHPLRQALLQLADQTVVAQQPGAVIAPLQQLVDQLIIDRRSGASCHVPLLGSLSWLNTQNLLHPRFSGGNYNWAGESSSKLRIRSVVIVVAPQNNLDATNFYGRYRCYLEAILPDDRSG